VKLGLTLVQKPTLRVFENSVLRSIFGTKEGRSDRRVDKAAKRGASLFVIFTKNN
jgi:hypothetical protein